MSTNITFTMILDPEQVAYLKECGTLDWGRVGPKTDEQHIADFTNSLRLTREWNKQEGPQELHGLYMLGTDVVAAHTGTSPKAAIRAQLMAGLWNALHATALAPRPDLAGVEVVSAVSMTEVRKALSDAMVCFTAARDHIRARQCEEALGLLGRGR